eukprot:9476760-Pyramimonas_sp.AAC.1
MVRVSLAASRMHHIGGTSPMGNVPAWLDWWTRTELVPLLKSVKGRDTLSHCCECHRCRAGLEDACGACAPFEECEEGAGSSGGEPRPAGARPIGGPRLADGARGDPAGEGRSC